MHGALEAAGRGVQGEALQAHVRGLLIAADRPIGRDGEPLEVAELLELVEAVRASDLWRRARAADRIQVEAPFAIAIDAAEYAGIAGRVGTPQPATGAVLEIVEGVLDLAFREEGRWTIVDYKSDEAGSGIDEVRRSKYRAQVELYAAAWERITGEPVRERVLLYTADCVPERW